MGKKNELISLSPLPGLSASSCYAYFSTAITLYGPHHCHASNIQRAFFQAHVRTGEDGHWTYSLLWYFYNYID